MIDGDSLKSIENLHRLKTEGVITEEEFDKAKQRVLFGQAPPSGRITSPTLGLSRFTGQLPAEGDHFGWITLPLRRYADFTGRSARKEFWMFHLIHVALLVIGVVFVGGTMDAYGEPSEFAKIVLGLIVLALFGLCVPFLALEARRFHDQDRSGWFILLNLIPYAGVIVVLAMMVLPGTRGENRFGPDTMP